MDSFVTERKNGLLKDAPQEYYLLSSLVDDLFQEYYVLSLLVDDLIKLQITHPREYTYPVTLFHPIAKSLPPTGS